MPGVPFVGGDDLVVWGYSEHERAALQLIQFLHTDETCKTLYPANGLPVCEDDWSEPPLNSEAYQVFKSSIQKGHGFPNARLWGLVEKRLTDTFSHIWMEALQNPETPPDAIVETHIEGLAKRLRLVLGD